MSAPGLLALVTVALLLAATLAAQFRAPAGRGRLLDPLALTPQWKFFGQSVLAISDVPLNDIHILARDRSGDGRIGQWQPLLSPGDRPILHSFWKPSGRRTAILLSLADDLASDPDAARHERAQQSLPYLVLLRHCLCDYPRPAGAEDRQFALVRTNGRVDRAMSVAFVSAFHAW